ncbi:MAG: hypothetical protein WAV28_18730 [Sedimentisphaerales bacterium]
MQNNPIKDLSKKVTITFSAIEWFALHGNACLGLRHPQNTGFSRRLCEDALQKLERKLYNAGLLTQTEIDYIHHTECQETFKCQNPPKP